MLTSERWNVFKNQEEVQLPWFKLLESLLVTIHIRKELGVETLLLRMVVEASS